MNPDRQPKGGFRFRFLVIADTHVNQEENAASSFFELNRLANQRAACAFACARRYKPDFVLHLGDIVHPIPSHPRYADAAQIYRDMAGALPCPIYLTPGNHDVGDKPWPLAPVACIDTASMRAYEEEFGDQWLSWSHGGCNFFILNTSLFNSGLPQEAQQQAWFEAALAKAGGRNFLALHYPPYVSAPEENSHYDNIDEPARNWLLQLIERHDVEAVFCGHVHNLWYDQFANAEMYLLPSTAFVRQDYSEMQRVRPPGEEGGRQDTDKLGFFVVDVYEHGHVAAFVRLPEKANAPEDDIFLRTVHSKTPLLPNLGIDPAYPWAEEVIIPPSGALDAFDSKKVRNDYPLFALFELGLDRMRISLSDLHSAHYAGRLLKLGKIGIRAQVVTTSLPTAEQRKWMKQLGPAIEALEFVATEAQMANQAAELAAFAAEFPDIALVLSKLRGPDDASLDGLHYGHLVFHGWIPAEAARISSMREQAFPNIGNIEPLYRVRFSESPLAMARQIAHLPPAARGGMLLRLATDNPALPQNEETALCAYVAETAVAAFLYPDMRITLDAMIDFDRGYFLRKGLYDRSFNPRAVVSMLRHLVILLCRGTNHFEHERYRTNNGTDVIRLSNEDETITLLFSAGHGSQADADWPKAMQAPEARCWDLFLGRLVAPEDMAAAGCEPFAYFLHASRSGASPSAGSPSAQNVPENAVP